MQQALVAVLAGLIGLHGVQGVNLRSQQPTRTTCPGSCSGNGDCAAGVCWCKLGWDGTDCETRASDSYDIKTVPSRDMEAMAGRYMRVPMYMKENTGNPESVQFINYDPIAQGWSISQLNSNCTDDICFFAYGKGSPVPPPKGYVYGEPQQHLYFGQLVTDDQELYAGRAAGYHMSVSYAPDPTAGVSGDLSSFTARYGLQPRYVHSNGKFAIMPVSLKAPGKLWFILGLQGVGRARRWKVIAQAEDKSQNRYTVPTSGWMAPGGGAPMNIEGVASCANHISMSVCQKLEDRCSADSGKNAKWIQSCCRDTCNACGVAENSCMLPNTAKGAAMLLQMANQKL